MYFVSCRLFRVGKDLKRQRLANLVDLYPCLSCMQLAFIYALKLNVSLLWTCQGLDHSLLHSRSNLFPTPYNPFLPNRHRLLFLLPVSAHPPQLPPSTSARGSGPARGHHPPPLLVHEPPLFSSFSPEHTQIICSLWFCLVRCMLQFQKAVQNRGLISLLEKLIHIKGPN